MARRGGRVVEGARLERVYAGNCIQGSNPCLSAMHFPVFKRINFAARMSRVFGRLADRDSSRDAIRSAIEADFRP